MGTLNQENKRGAAATVPKIGGITLQPTPPLSHAVGKMWGFLVNVLMIKLFVMQATKALIQVKLAVSVPLSFDNSSCISFLFH